LEINISRPHRSSAHVVLGDVCVWCVSDTSYPISVATRIRSHPKYYIIILLFRNARVIYIRKIIWRILYIIHCTCAYGEGLLCQNLERPVLMSCPIRGAVKARSDKRRLQQYYPIGGVRQYYGYFRWHWKISFKK